MLNETKFQISQPTKKPSRIADWYHDLRVWLLERKIRKNIGPDDHCIPIRLKQATRRKVLDRVVVDEEIAYLDVMGLTVQVVTGPTFSVQEGKHKIYLHFNSPFHNVDSVSAIWDPKTCYTLSNEFDTCNKGGFKNEWQFVAFLIRERIWVYWMGMTADCENGPWLNKCRNFIHMTPFLQHEMVRKHGGQLAIMNIKNPVPELQERYGHFVSLAESGII